MAPSSPAPGCCLHAILFWTRRIRRHLLSGLGLAGCLLLAAAGLHPHPAAAQDGETTLVRGFVTDASNGQNLHRANVVLLQNGAVVQAVATNSDGFYQLSGLAPATYVLRVSYIGYRTSRDTISLTEGARRRDVALTPQEQQLAGVTVEAQQDIRTTEAGREEIEPADIEAIPTPGPGSDLAGYLRSLPQVTAIGDRGGRLYVRGGRPSQNLILVDGIPVYKPFHILGFYSAFPADLVQSADFYAGGFTAEYMGRTSSVLDVNLRSGNTKRYAGAVSASPFLSQLRVEGPLLEEASFMTSYRQSLIEETAPTLIGEDSPQYFYDLIGKVTGTSDQARCSATLLRTYDRGRIDPDRDASVRWTNTSAGGHCLAFGESSAQVVDLSVGGSHFGNRVRTTDGSTREASTWIIRTHLRVGQPVRWGQVEWGLWAQVNQYSVDLNETLLASEADDDFQVTAGGFTQTTLELGAEDQIQIEPSVGLRTSPFSLEPRVRASWAPGGSDTRKITAAGGLYRQIDAGITDERDAGSVFLAWLPTPIEDRLVQSTHALVGWKERLAPGLTMNVEGYYKDFREIPVPKWTAITTFNTNLTLADGRSYGGDIQLRYRRDPLDLRVSYGLNWVTYRADSQDLDAWNQSGTFTYAPPHDRRHQVSVVASTEIAGIQSSVRWQLGTGRPFTQAYGYDTLPILRGLEDQVDRDVGIPRLLYDEPYNARLPTYHRLDLSAERTFTLSPRVGLTAEAGAINAYNRSNLFYVDIFTQERVDQLPFLPYLSFTVSLR
jgi:hypothetical protein